MANSIAISKIHSSLAGPNGSRNVFCQRLTMDLERLLLRLY
jgi:hypothetical protein